MNNDHSRPTMTRTVLLALTVAVMGTLGQAQTAPSLKFYKLQPSQITPAAAKLIADKQGFRFVQSTDAPNEGVFTDANGGVTGFFSGGGIRFFPNLDGFSTDAPAPPLATAQGALNKYLGVARGLFPGDGSVSKQGDSSLWTVSFGDGGGAGAPVTRSETKPFDAFRSARLVRYYDGLPRYGQRSTLGGVVDGRGNMVGFTDSFLPAVQDTSIPAPIMKTSFQLDQEASIRIRGLAQGSPFKVLKREAAYYEQGLNYLQPVYFYEVLFTPQGGPPQGEVVIIPMAVNSPEPIFQHARGADQPISPDISLPTGKQAKVENDDLWATTAPAAATAQANPLVLGQYVVKNDYDGWLNDANAFYSGINQGRFLSSLVFSRPNIVRRDWYWDEVWMWEPYGAIPDHSPWFVNQDNVVQIQGHGAPWLITCLQNNAEVIHLNQSAGYGGNRLAGKTSHVILQSCDMIPEPGHPFEADFTAGHSAFDVWWTWFKGMHSTAGYRTIMHVYNQVGGPYGLSLGFGCPVASSWLSCTDQSYFHHSNGWDYGNIVYVTGHGGDTVYNNNTLPNPTSLTMWWIHA